MPERSKKTTDEEEQLLEEALVRMNATLDRIEAKMAMVMERLFQQAAANG